MLEVLFDQTVQKSKNFKVNCNTNTTNTFQEYVVQSDCTYHIPHTVVILKYSIQ